MEHSDIEKALSIVEKVFRGYRSTLLNVSGTIEFTEKEDKSPITALDLEIEKSVQTELKVNYPNLRVYGEETGYEPHMQGAFWLIDPIDGTKSFINGTPSFSNMAALIENGETVAAIIYNPSRNDVYTAIKGNGTLKNGNRVDISLIKPEPVVLCKSEFEVAITKMLGPLNIRTEVPPSGGGDGFTKILDGYVSARFQMHASGYAHDYAPGALLASEAGGVIVPIKDDVYTFESQSFVACHPYIADLMRENVSKLRELDS